ncbi:MAG: hypothetical protein EPO61_09340 [Nitrospirae bacterium]|nr:MAG: hypothetical protein EPO61_09340 [Nitrospirota bacterium]
MKIRRKAAKLPPSAPPLYIVGYRSSPPPPEELAIWFNLEYGGPLRLQADPGPSLGGSSQLRAAHGPWEAAIRLLLPAADAEAWQESLAWGHPNAGQVLLMRTSPSKAIDLVLHAARLARGLTLLTGGTAYDLRTQTYLNPSDWQDRPLTQFAACDHMTVEQSDADEAGRERFYTKGLAKFGLDELEVFRPMGLPGRPTSERLTDIAEMIIRLGQSPKVGASLTVPDIGLTLSITKHRTVPAAEGPVAFREVAW